MKTMMPWISDKGPLQLAPMFVDFCSLVLVQSLAQLEDLRGPPEVVLLVKRVDREGSRGRRQERSGCTALCV